MQVNEIKAFRQRLVRAGFSNIHIYEYKYGLYHVICTKPNGQKVDSIFDLAQIRNIPRLVFFD